MSVPRISRTFLGTPRSIAEARHFVNAMLNGWPEAPDAALIVSELATNAVRHSQSARTGGRFTVSIQITTDRLWLGVQDEGGPSLPQASPPHPDEENGRGLLLVTELAAKWGVTGDHHGRTVWALLELLPKSAIQP
ncbi:ATP-binding protein [Microtetraspora sp. NBRC 13810]|uniref:ATP-binding protein n=1 Tax=Microtetraspora sp. NBRC 13810 TaxID=3030990 RepID=UPI0024A121D1|nr:ATP-binding protein [Microtetraspora sp. NBRC 13810]GLW07886.1 ATP-binding protein [Microtetraspora sp. NBRC 13810]